MVECDEKDFKENEQKKTAQYAGKYSILIVAGMHRSGTSLTTSLLESTGLHIGERLIAPSKGNVKGSFENIDFFEFHRAVLKSQGLDADGWTFASQIQVPDSDRGKTKGLIGAPSRW